MTTVRKVVSQKETELETVRLIDREGVSSSHSGKQRPINFHDSRSFSAWEVPPREDEQPEVPVKSIVMAVLMFSFGTLFIVGGIFLTFLGWTPGKDGQDVDRGYALLVLGSLLFLPGFFYTRIAFWAWRGEEGFEFDMIPDSN